MKMKLLITAKVLIFLGALTQLALSQIHIEIITKVFQPAIGFFLFMFIIFGVVLAFSTSGISKGEFHAGLFTAMFLAAMAAGGVYLGILLRDVRAENLLTYGEAGISIWFSLSTMAIYLIASILTIVGFTGHAKH